MTKEQSQYRKGVFQVVFCMVIWGVLPIYWHIEIIPGRKSGRR